MTTCTVLLGALLTAIGIVARLATLRARGVTIPLPPNVRSRNGYNRQDALEMFDESEEIS